MATKEEIAAAAKAKFLTVDVEIAPGLTVTLRELTTVEKRVLDLRLWQAGPDGELLVKPENGKDMLVPVVGVHHREEWLAATMTPAFTVEELLAGWPEPLKLDLYRQAAKINGANLADAVGNS